MEAKCKEYGWSVIAVAMQLDHVYWFVEASPRVPASEVVKQCQGVTAYE